MQVNVENNVDWYGFDKEKYTNATRIADTKVGDEVLVFDLSNYVNPKAEFPAKAIVTAVYEYEIDVIIEGEWAKYEIYESQFGERIQDENLIPA